MSKGLTVVGWLGLLALVLASGCAEVKYAMHTGEELTLVWPSQPDRPRFRYEGQLTGFQNFKVAEGQPGPGAAEIALMYLVGVDPATGWREGEVPGVLQRPQSGLVDDLGRILVTDASRGAIYVFDHLAGKLHIWNKARPFVSFSTPVGITKGPNGTILVADAELAQIFILDRDGTPVGSFGDVTLMRPTGLARDEKRGEIYVADTTADHIKVFDDHGQLLRALGQSGEANEEFNAPTHLAFANDQLYVTDTFNTRVQVVDRNGKWLKTIGSRGVNVGNFARPKGVAVDSRGLIYVVESFFDHILIFDQDGNFLMPIGGTGKEIGKFYLPSGVWTDGGDRIFVADMFNGRVIIFRYIGDK